MICSCSSLFSQPSVSLRDLGLSEVRVSELGDLVSRLLPVPSPEEPPTVNSIWRTSHVSADSFFQNKHGERHNQMFYELSFYKISLCFILFLFSFKGVSQRRLWSSGSPLFRRQYHSPLREVCSELHFLPGTKIFIIQL